MLTSTSLASSPSSSVLSSSAIPTSSPVVSRQAQDDRGLTDRTSDAHEDADQQGAPRGSSVASVASVASVDSTGPVGSASSKGKRSRPTIDEMPSWQRWQIGLRAFREVMKNPERTDQVLVMGVHLNASAAPGILAMFQGSPDGQRLLREHRAIDASTVSLDALETLADGTLGREYARMMRANGLTPDIFTAPDNVAHPEVMYISQRLRQVHDLWHVVTGYSTDVPGEIELQAFTYAQVSTPSSLLIAALGSIRYMGHGKRLVRRARLAYDRGKRARSFATFPWEDHWATPVSELRARLGC